MLFVTEGQEHIESSPCVRDQLIEEYLQRNNGDVHAAIADLKKAYKEIPLPAEVRELLVYLNAISALEERLKE